MSKNKNYGNQYKKNYNQNYNKYSTKQNDEKVEEHVEEVMVNDEVIEEQVIEEQVIEKTVIEEIKENDEVKESIFGEVNCDRLNVRLKPSISSEVVCVITKNTTVEIFEEGSTEDFYKVLVYKDTDGFCMKKFITVK